MAEAGVATAPGAVNNTTQHMTLVDWLDDLTVRFLLNLPPAELSSVPRICFQIEEAQWFYEDFIRPANPTLPSLNLRQFLLALFQHCPLLQGFDAAHHVAAYEEFLSYKTRVPVRGAIILDDTMEKVLLVKGWKKGASWSFPRGKINKDEPDLDCAVREVYEETGFDMEAEGLVKANLQEDGQVKAIDVTMNQQHLKLFVFRGVALDTYFEPKTRKEISKISWYNVKDLPGFKKQKGAAGHGQGEAQSSKFYMVAPFLGHLKKWIGQQRRNDAAQLEARHARNLSGTYDGVPSGITEDEGEAEQEGFTSDAGFATGDRSADELKRILSIGGPSPQSAMQEQRPPSHTNNLLAMLQGGPVGISGGTMPHTPLEQIDPMFPARQPQTPQPHHPRQPSSGFQQPPSIPQFPYSPHRLQPQHGQNPNFTPAGYGSSSGPFGPSQLPGLPPHMQQHDRQPSIPGFVHGQGNVPQPGPYANAAASSFNLYQQTQAGAGGYFGGNPVLQHAPHLTGQSAQLASPMHFETGTSRPPAGLPQIFQESQKPIGSETPEASKLPSLSIQSKKLLDAFKVSNAGKPKTSAPANTAAGQRAGSAQQAALLDLFKKPHAAPVSSEPGTVAPPSPTLTDITVKPTPPPKPERKATLNEITRTLPPKRSPSVAATAPRKASGTLPEKSQQRASTSVNAQVPLAQASSPQTVPAERPHTRGQLFDPANPRKSVRADSESRKEEQKAHVPPVAILQRPNSRQGQTTYAPKISSPKAVQKPNPNENGQPVPAFSILQRPGSAAGKPRPPQSPLRHESAKATLPQVLTANQTSSGAGMPPSDKKDHLLSLFAKGPAAASSPPAPAAAVASRGSQQHDTLLGLLNGGRPPSVAPVKTPEPPPAPQLVPERKPSSQAQRANGSQQLLLNLFNKPASSAVSSPSTPISPFTLGTPITREAPGFKQPLPLSLQPSVEARSHFSAASNGTPTASGQATPTSATPTNETKGFLLDYLKGVVQSEGHRGAKRA